MEYRKSARVVLLNDRNEVFMFLSGDLTRTDPARGEPLRYWVLPGGGLEAGESWEEAALREMWEETGIGDVAPKAWLWTRKGRNRPGAAVPASEERYFLVRCGGREVSNANQLPHEREHYTVSRWWSLSDMRTTTDILYPEGLADLMEPVIAGEAVRTPVLLPQ